MQIIISHSKTKRKINGAFALCGSADDLRRIVDCIQSAIGDGAYYGWVDICEKTEPLANTPPEIWDEFCLTMRAMGVCQRCGTNFVDGAEFCYKCGTHR